MGNLDAARKVAEDKVNEMAAGAGVALAISGMTEVEGGWVFYYNSAEFLRTGNFSSQLAGNGPIFVSHDGAAHVLPTAIPWKIALERIHSRGMSARDEAESLNSLPSFHDDFLISYEVDCEARRIRLRSRSATGTAQSQLREIVFTGVEAYHFENDAFGNIIFSLRAVSVEELVLRYGEQIAESYRASGAPGPWAADLVTAAQALSAKGVQGFILTASYGLSGWVIAGAGVVARQTGSPQHPH